VKMAVYICLPALILLAWFPSSALADNALPGYRINDSKGSHPSSPTHISGHKPKHHSIHSSGASGPIRNTHTHTSKHGFSTKPANFYTGKADRTTTP
jgi:hypothetical protein